MDTEHPPAERTCRACGTPLGGDAAYCESCGADAPRDACGSEDDFTAAFESRFRFVVASLVFIASLVAGAFSVCLVLAVVTDLGVRPAAAAFGVFAAFAAVAAYFALYRAACPRCGRPVLAAYRGWPLKHTDFTHCPECGARLRRGGSQ
jgi:hypothetical protein